MPTSDPTELGDDVEAFLAGRYGACLAAQQRPRPYWTLLNKVAHGTRDELVDAADDVDSPGSKLATIERCLARHAVAASIDDESLRALQRELLVPLELEAIAREPFEAVTVIGLAGVAIAALSALAEHPDRADA